MSLPIYSHPSQRSHDPGPGHAECPARLTSIEAHLAACDLDLDHRVAQTAPEAALRRVHHGAHVDRVLNNAPTEGRRALDPDTIMSPDSLLAARTAAGAVLQAVDEAIDGGAPRAFCAVRPPGHHATAGEAMGFCFFASVAVAAAHALEAGLGRVVICDFDVHHGNGTEDIFRDDDRVMVCQTFQWPLYPGRPFAQSHHRLVNVPLAAGSGSAAFRDAVREAWVPSIRDFQPELVLVSAGFDAHVDDPLGGLRFVEEDYAWVTTQLRELAESHAGGRIVSALEGGYDLHALPRSVEAHLRALA